jgi:hypothetical protein
MQEQKEHSEQSLKTFKEFVHWFIAGRGLMEHVSGPASIHN